TLDGRTGHVRLLRDGDALRSLARAAVTAGGGHVLDETIVVFPNGAITLVLVLAESHLSLHTWPEDRLVAIDLFCCGGTAAGRALAARLGAEAGMACTCASCAGSGVVLAGEVAHVRRQLAEALRAAPPADRRLDQAHSTIDAKLRRIAYLEEAGALSGRSVL